MRDIDAIETVGVVGAGTMGSGIAQVAATSGYDVVMRDVEPGFVEDGLDSIEGSLDRFVDDGKMARAEADAALDRIEGTTDLEAVKPPRTARSHGSRRLRRLAARDSLRSSVVLLPAVLASSGFAERASPFQSARN